jgi:exonuclease III
MVDPGILFLCETKLNQQRMEWLRWKLGLTHMVVKDCVGQGSGGLAMFWRDGVNLKARLKSKYHIDAEITEEDGSKWRFTGIYGEPKLEGREATWCLLRTIRHHSDKPWICAGDFNEILMQCEKEGGTARTQIYMDRFNEALEDCGLHDLGFTGDPFTWHNNSHDASRYIRERLDRVVATQEWCNKFMSYRVEHGDPRHSDHRPVIIHINEDVPVQRRSTIKRP